MCKVSTLNNVEPPSINVFCKVDQLPKINKCRNFRQPLVLIDEQNGLNLSLPQLRETNLPPATSTSSVSDKVGNECEPNDCTKNKKGYEDLPKCRRASTPFVTANPKMMPPTLDETNENIPVSAVPLATDRRKMLNRSRLCATLSYPGASSNALSAATNLSRVPTPPKSPPKNRPETPFLLTRSRSVDAKKYRLQTVGDTKGGIDGKGSREEPSMVLLDEDSFTRNKFERDKLEKFNEEKVTMKGAIPAGKSDGHSCKIRMDMTAFTKWIEEHRLH